MNLFTIIYYWLDFDHLFLVLCSIFVVFFFTALFNRSEFGLVHTYIIPAESDLLRDPRSELLVQVYLEILVRRLLIIRLWLS
jgi:hypothetical protein